MTNVVELNAIEIATEEEKTLSGIIAKYTHEIEDLDQQVKDLTSAKLNLTVEANNCKNAKEQKELKAELKIITAKIAQLKNAHANVQERLETANIDLMTIRKQKNIVVAKQTSQSTAEKVFKENNIHYVVFNQEWWSVDPAGDRLSVKINASDADAIKDLIYLDSDWEITNNQELKRIAKSLGRMYKHIVRDFNTKSRPGVYNQMTDIRKHWLAPIYDVEPHESFRLLTLSIAGGKEDYADQLEKFVAYRYCHPEDVMIPNIDSCATGGTGRDTYANLIRIIFTNECCGSAGEETFKGTHNGDLFGKMFVTVDEKDSIRVPIDKIKELTGKARYRHREMQKNGKEADRLFTFMFFRNGYTTTVKLANTGSDGEDRRWEPIIARVNLARHIAYHYKVIDDINTPLDPEQSRAIQSIAKTWQKDYYQNETRVAEWLGHIITKHRVKEMTELLPLHGVYYREMIARQNRGIDGFMPKVLKLMKDTTVLCVKDIHKLYEASESVKISKDGFKNQMLYWLNTKAAWDAECVQSDIYLHGAANSGARRRLTIIRNRLNPPKKEIFDLEEFIDITAEDEKGQQVGRKINPFSLRDELK